MIICLEMAVVKYIKVLSVVLIYEISPLRHKLLQCGISTFSDGLPCKALNFAFATTMLFTKHCNVNIFAFFFASRSVESSSVPSS